jgi:hypothetical protein
MQQQNPHRRGAHPCQGLRAWQAARVPRGLGRSDWIEAERLLRAELSGADPGDSAHVAEEPEEPPSRCGCRRWRRCPWPRSVPRRAPRPDRIPVEPAREPAPEDLTVPSAGVVVSSSRARDVRGSAAAAAPVSQRGVATWRRSARARRRQNAARTDPGRQRRDERQGVDEPPRARETASPTRSASPAAAAEREPAFLPRQPRRQRSRRPRLRSRAGTVC